MPCPVSLSWRHQAEAHFQHQALCPALSLSFHGQAHFQHQALCPVSLSLSAVRHTSCTKHCVLPRLSLLAVRHTSSTKHFALPRLSLSFGGQAHFQHQALCPVSLSLSAVRHTSCTKHCVLPRLSLSSQAHFQHQALCTAPSLSLSQQSGTLPAPSTVPCPVCLSFGGQAHFQHRRPVTF